MAPQAREADGRPVERGARDGGRLVAHGGEGAGGVAARGDEQRDREDRGGEGEQTANGSIPT